MLKPELGSSPLVRRHAPAGRPVPASALKKGPWTERAFSVPPELFDSGTSALAVALKRLVKKSADDRPAVALPAYACPNLVAATLWAGGTPRYYDISLESLGPDPESLQRLAGSASAIVLVDAFGAKCAEETLAQMEWLASRSEQIVHDLAQSFAVYSSSWRPVAEQTVVSFGKAKPMSLTFGGALFSLGPGSPQELPSSVSIKHVSAAEFALRASIYRNSLGPLGFGVLSRVPLLGVGKTQFDALEHPARIPEVWRATVNSGALETRASLTAYQQDSDRIIELALRAGANVPRIAAEALGRLPLWRVPVVCASSAAADELRVRAGHLGVSRLYERPLPQIVSSSPQDLQCWPKARHLAERLVTLPTHGRVSSADLNRLEAMLRLASHSSS